MQLDMALLKIATRRQIIWGGKSLSALLDMRSGPGAFLGLRDLMIVCTSSTVTGGRAVVGGRDERRSTSLSILAT